MAVMSEPVCQSLAWLLSGRGVIFQCCVTVFWGWGHAYQKHRGSFLFLFNLLFSLHNFDLPSIPSTDLPLICPCDNN